MSVTIDRIGYAVVEENILSAKREGRVYAQLPAAEAIEVLENGQFVKYDYANGEVNFTGDGEWFMVYNEEKLYDERHQMHRDFAMKAEDYFDGKMYPRVIGIHAGDLFTTNALKPGDYTVGDKLKVGDDGWLAAGDAATGEHAFKVVKEYTLPDGQPAVKIQAIA
jgi:hypothetical protein